ncbi:MAG: hypothetical protein IJ658_12530, partial [Kiritimatiellae bacterium]|nr:hypothetical protein [Kiritimatiellia bacterium]
RRPPMSTQFATALVVASARAQGVQLNAAQTTKAVALVAEFGDGMFGIAQRLLARFVVSLRLTDASAELDRRRLQTLAPELLQWRELGFGTPGKEAVEFFFKTEANAFILDYEKPDAKAANFYGDVFNTFTVDAPRGYYTIAGKRFNSGSKAADVLAELDKLNLAPAAKRALTALMSQASALPMLGLQMHSAQPPHDLRRQPIDPSTLPGAGAFVSRKQTDMDEFLGVHLVDKLTSIYDLSVSEDGKTAVLKIVKGGRLVVGTEDATMESGFGSCIVEEELTIDLSTEVPTVTNVRLAQTFDDTADLQQRYLDATAPIPAPPPIPPAPVPDIPVQNVNAPQDVNAPQNVNAPQLPRITNQDEFTAFFLSLKVTDKFGQAAEDEVALDVNGNEATTYTYKGFVFRGDDRRPEHPTMGPGFTSQNDLSVPANKIEAMGLGTTAEDGTKGSFGVTGKSGVSTAKSINGAIAYHGAGSTFYVIDTTKLPQGEKAWDMENTVYQNAYKVRERDEDDETMGEVNISYVPRNAIVGWIRISRNSSIDDVVANEGRLETLKDDPNTIIEFNPEYRP